MLLCFVETHACECKSKWSEFTYLACTNVPSLALQMNVNVTSFALQVNLNDPLQERETKSHCF